MKFGNITLFIPIYGDQLWLMPGISTVVYYALISIELAALIYNTIFATFAIAIWSNTSIFHRNLLNIGICLYCNAYLHILSRSIIILFQLKILIPNDVEFYWTNIVIALASVMRQYQSITIVFQFTSLVIERFFATIFLHDYDQKRRSWIFRLLFIFIVLISSIMTVFRSFEFVYSKLASTVFYVYYFTVTMIGIAIVIFNYRRVSRLLLSNRYSLSAKFQLQENMKAFKFVIPCVASSVTTAVVAGGIFAYSEHHRDDLNIVAICGAAYETATTIIYGASVTICVFTQPEWRVAMKRKLLACLRCGHESPEESSVLAPQLQPRENRIAEDREVYFRDLFNVWDKTYKSRDARRK